MPLKSGFYAIEAPKHFLEVHRLLKALITLMWVCIATDFSPASIWVLKKRLGINSCLSNAKIFFSSTTMKLALGSRRKRSALPGGTCRLNLMNLLGIGNKFLYFILICILMLKSLVSQKDSQNIIKCEIWGFHVFRKLWNAILQNTIVFEYKYLIYNLFFITKLF